MQDIKEFHKSTSKELKSIQNRVRNLIGRKNWGVEGTYKEAILKNVIKRFLPERFEIGTGFVIIDDWRKKEIEVTSQIDLIIYDKFSPVFFKEGDFIIITPEYVRGIIEVKTDISNISNEKFIEAIKIMNENGRLIFYGRNGEEFLFNGLFSYDYKITNEESLKDRIKNEVYNQLMELYIKDFKARDYFVNYIALNQDYFIDARNSDRKMKGYKLENLAFSYFISSFIWSLRYYVNVSQYSLWHPFGKDIEQYQKFEFPEFPIPT